MALLPPSPVTVCWSLMIFLSTVSKGKDTPQINHISLKLPAAPPLSQLEDVPTSLFCNASAPPEPDCRTRYCGCLHMLRVELGSLVELVLIDESKYTEPSCTGMLGCLELTRKSSEVEKAWYNFFIFVNCCNRYWFLDCQNKVMLFSITWNYKLKQINVCAPSAQTLVWDVSWYAALIFYLHAVILQE